jgi:hypothetical protein
MFSMVGSIEIFPLPIKLSSSSASDEAFDESLQLECTIPIEMLILTILTMYWS